MPFQFSIIRPRTVPRGSEKSMFKIGQSECVFEFPISEPALSISHQGVDLVRWWKGSAEKNCFVLFYCKLQQSPGSFLMVHRGFIWTADQLSFMSRLAQREACASVNILGVPF